MSGDTVYVYVTRERDASASYTGHILDALANVYCFYARFDLILYLFADLGSDLARLYILLLDIQTLSAI